jgi:hypothetical protein
VSIVGTVVRVGFAEPVIGPAFGRTRWLNYFFVATVIPTNTSP